MDLHKGVPKLSEEEMKQIHEADLAVQDKYGVKYHKFWVNEEAGTVFCLVEGPNKEACIHTHKDAHGLLPCEIVEVKPSDVTLIMGDVGANGIGRAVHTDGHYDSSVRTFLFTDIVGSTDLTQSVGDVKAMTIIRKHNEVVRNNLITHDGKEIKHTGDGIMACFVSAFKAVNCAKEIQKALKTFRNDNPEYPLHVRIGLNTGEPVTEGDDFFGTTVQLAARLCNKAESGQVLVSNIVKELCMGKDINFSDLGQTELKGFSSPMLIYQVEW